MQSLNSENIRLALDDDILMSVEKPGRYIGNEVNAVYKDKQDVNIRFCMCFPDTYEIGMSHLGKQLLYSMFNSIPYVWCERVYSPWFDLDLILKDRDIPLFALESQDPIRDFDFLGITLQYEMCYTNILQILELSNISFYSKDRGEDEPLVIAGGPCTYNSEPIADFFDFIYIGEGETKYYEIMELYKVHKEEGRDRRSFLRKVATVDGIYVPSLYEVKYLEDGRVESYIPMYEDVPKVVRKEVVRDINSSHYPMKPIVPYIKAVQDRVVLEIQRGCIRGCRFCQAGQVYKPTRERDVDVLKSYAKHMLDSTGHEEISLSSLSSSDYSALGELINYLIDYCGERNINISLPSLRIDAFALDIMSKVQDIKKSSLTFAPEAGSQRMRNVINKGITKEDILRGCSLAFEGGWNRIKLYFMLGLPTETQEDIEAIGELCNDIAALYFEQIPKEERGQGSINIVASSSFFIPKPFTPFQWWGMNTPEEFVEKAYVCKEGVKRQLNQKRIRYNWHEAYTGQIEGLLARGDRRLSKVIEKAYRKGAIFEAWSEHFDYQMWVDAMASEGLDIEFYTTRTRDVDEVLPWDIIDVGVTKKFLWNEWNNSVEGKINPNCRMKCSGCGVATFGTGVCK